MSEAEIGEATGSPVSKAWERQRLCWRVHGPFDGTLIGIYRWFYRRRWYRVGYLFQAVSDRYETWRFWRMYDRIMGAPKPTGFDALDTSGPPGPLPTSLGCRDYGGRATRGGPSSSGAGGGV